MKYKVSSYNIYKEEKIKNINNKFYISRVERQFSLIQLISLSLFFCNIFLRHMFMKIIYSFIEQCIDMVNY